MDYTVNESYGDIIKDLRIEMGMTQNEVAAAMNVTPGYISNVENNRTAMSLRMLTYFAKLSGPLEIPIGLKEELWREKSP